MEKRNYDHRLWLGVGAVMLGLFLLANNFGIFDYEIRRYILRWEVLLMFLGIVFITGRGKRSTGIILLVIGGIFYLRDFLHYSFSFWQLFWPVNTNICRFNDHIQAQAGPRLGQKRHY